ncbi:hypothetical protein DFP73DRAFT_578448 [Morchella snyderi]|nr:hypothetical protein DFP73DRAFT_578448 [Morchella snyderi]
MFRPLTLWQNIPCPALDARGSCTVTQCLFSHARAPAAPPPRLPPPPPPPAPPAPHPPRPNAPDTTTTTTPLPPPPPPPPLSLVAALSGDPRLRKIIEANANASPTPPTPPSDDGCDHKRRRALDDPAPPPPPPGPDNSAAAGVDVGVSVDVDADADSSHPPATKRTRTRVDTAPKSILKKSPQTAAAPKTTTTNGAGGKAGATTTTTALAKSAVPQQGPSAPPPPPPPTTATAKPLSLNPRLVPSAPATHAARLKLLTLLHGEYVRLHAGRGDAQAVLKLALDEEEKVAREMRSIYSQAMKKRIVRLKNTAPADFAREQAKKEEQEEEGRRRGGAGGGGGRTAQGRAVDHGLDNEKPPLDTGLAPDQELRALAPLLQVPAELVKYKYILEPPTAAEVEAAASGTAAAGGWEACDRCSSRFQVFDGRRESDGQLASGGKCTYHWGRAAWPSRSSGNRAPKDTERIFTCCRQRVGQSAGCTTCDNHVYKISEAKRLASLWQFIKTPAPAPAPAPSPPPGPGPPAKKPIARALCVDCEMCYTTHGMELIRLTATAFPSGHTVIDALVRPAGGILDLNTRFSGVSSAQLVAAAPHTPLPYPPLPASAADYLSPTATSSAGAAAAAAAPLQILPSPEAARALLLRYVDAETPLVGHALENDLGVLRLCHACVVDTAVLFPHARGLPMRNKLKYLVERYLERRIQVEEDAGGEVGEGARAAAMAARGHDSAVDARCAGELVRWKIREEMVLERAGRREKGG